MTPEFAKAVDPVFMRVLNLRERIDRDDNLSPKEQQLAIQGDLEAAERQLGQSPQWELAKYGLVSWIDEILIEAPWGEGREWWKGNSLEWKSFKTNDRFEQFFVRAQQAGTLPRKDALEVFYVCLVLGFRGLYRDPVQAPALAKPLTLPENIETWARQTAMAIHYGDDRPEITRDDRPIEGAEPLEGPMMLIWAVFLAMVLGAATGIAAWVYHILPWIEGQSS